MALFRWLLRKRQSKGYGIHSPFAFNLITQILYSSYSYYAFSDILKKVGHDPEKEINQISFRLVNHFKPNNILEINPGNGVSSLYITSQSAVINYTSVETIHGIPQVEELASYNKYDAIFINLDGKENFLPSLENLFGISNENCFWVINTINKKLSKQLWRHIVNDSRISVTFDFKNKTGIAFMRSAYYKQHFSV